jgi:hypothetical protein
MASHTTMECRPRLLTISTLLLQQMLVALARRHCTNARVAGLVITVDQLQELLKAIAPQPALEASVASQIRSDASKAKATRAKAPMDSSKVVSQVLLKIP